MSRYSPEGYDLGMRGIEVLSASIGHQGCRDLDMAKHGTNNGA